MSFRNDQVSELETEKIAEIARGQVSVPGDFVELGCYKGDTSLLLAEILKQTGKKLWIYDSFEGLPEKSESDLSPAGVDFKGGELFVTKREVKERFLRSGLPVPVIKKAWFKDLKETDLPEEIAFAFLDGDFYESIKESLDLIEKKISDKTVVVVHDYNNTALPGVAKAVDEWLQGRELKTVVYQSMLIINK